MSPASVDEVIGRLLDGRYRVEARIARGGMATVYRAMDSRLDRPVAVKIMHSHLAADSDFAARFVREARAAARLNHIGVVGVYDQGADDGLVYLAMEYVPGRTLRDVISDEAPLPPLRAVRLMERVLDALAAAHAAKIVHRDVKPENVLIGPENVVKVADFGLARAITADSTTTATGGLLIGTVSYLAPELVLGENADARSDVYAAGIVLFELLTGEKPHRGETPIQVAYRHVNDDVPPPSSRDHQLDWPIPDFVDALVARATTREPAMRPTDAGVLLRQLRRVRSALEQGVRDDPDLADVLRPQAGHRDDTLPDALPDALRDPPPEPLSDPLPDPLLEPVPAGALATAPPADGHEHTLVVGVVSDDEGSAVPDDSSSGPPTTTARQGRGAPAAPTRRRRRGMWWLVVVLLLALLAGLGGWWFGVGRFTDTPDLVRMSEAQARQSAVASGLDTSIGGTRYSETVPAGAVVATDPGPGERIQREGTIELILSKGKERYAVPDLSGQPLDQAEQELADTNLALGDQQLQWSGRVDEGSVISTVQRVGRMLKPDSTIDVVVSRGPRPIDIEDVTGQPLPEAREALGGAGFEVSVVDREFSDSVARGAVISQSPDRGTGFRGDRVELVVSKGPELVEVPSLTGASADEATEQLEALGLEVEEVKFFGDSATVVRQSPGGGDLVEPGSTVTLYLV